MRKVYKLENLDCANCASKIENAIKQIVGVKDASVSFMTQKLMIDIADEEIERIIKEVQKVMNKIEPDCEIIFE